MNSPGPSIERSTWLSAARFMTQSGGNVSSAARAAARSQMSPRTKRNRGSPATGRQRGEIAGVGQLVVDQNLMRRGLDDAARDRRTDEPGAAGDQNPFGRHKGFPRTKAIVWARFITISLRLINLGHA